MNDSTKGTTIQDPEWVQENDWTNAEPGDTVRLVNGDGAEATVTVRAVQVTVMPDAALWIRSYSGVIYYSDAWTLFVKVPPRLALPTEPGYYQDRVEDVWTLTKSGKWLAGEDPGDPAIWTPLTRLEPVSETAKKVLDRVRADDAFIPGPYFELILSAIGAEFGVTS